MSSRPPRSGDALRPRPGSPLDRLLDAIGSIPFGVAMIVLVLAWCWIGSAGTAPFGSWFIRQSFEKTEMEWFSWWPFNLMLALLALSLILATIRRIPWSLPNLGVWTIHTGIIVLMVGGAVYFGRKLEGDLTVYRRAVQLTADGLPAVSLALQPGAETRVPAEDGEYIVRVVALDSDYRLLTGADEGKSAYAAQLMVEPPAVRLGARPFIRQVIDGYPQYTEDVLPGQGRAIKTIGRALVDERLRVTVDYAGSDRVHLNDRPALHARLAGSGDWSEYPLRGLPRYHERLADPSEVRFSSAQRTPNGRRLDLRPRAKQEDPALRDLSIRVTGFLPAAWVDQTRLPGGDEFGPLLRLQLERDGLSGEAELLALDPERSSLTREDGLTVSFHWMDAADPARFAEASTPPSLVVRSTERGIDRRLAVSDLLARPIEIGGGLTLQAERFVPQWVLASTGERASMILVRVEDQDRSYVRAVLHPQIESSRDFDSDGQILSDLLDPGLSLNLEDVREPGLRVVADPEGLHGIYTGDDGSVRALNLTPGVCAEFDSGRLQATVLAYERNSRAVVRPIAIPPQERDAKAGPSLNLVRVEIAHGSATETRWLRYSHYVEPSRMGYYPQTVRLEGMPPIELLFSRETLRLAEPVALEEFQLETFPGGTREREFRSMVRFRRDGRWTEPRVVETNSPTQEAGWWFFQSTWDPPDPSTGYAGLNHTGLGVGNRHGVGVMLCGGIMTVAGTIWAFYVKPVLLRRRARRAAKRTERGATPARIVAEDRGALPEEAITAGSGSHVPGALLLLMWLSLGVLTGLAPNVAHAANESPLTVSPNFASALDLSRIRLIAVQEDGRVKTFDSLAREKLRLVNARAARRTDPVLWYLDLMLAPEAVTERTVVRIQKPAFRRQLVQTIRALVPPASRSGEIAPEELARIEREGLVSPAFLSHPQVRAATSVLERDLMRTGKEVQKLHTAWALADAGVLSSLFRVVPTSEIATLPWLTIEELSAGGSPHADSLDPVLARKVEGAWSRLGTAWAEEDAATANRALAELADGLPQFHPAAYPPVDRMRWEHWYYKNDKLTGTWILYFFALPFLLMAVVYGLRWARGAGLALFGLGFALHTFSIFLRWWLAGRIPNANMFEAITASAWFGGLVALVLELLLRRRPVRNLPALAASTYAMLALMAGHFIPVLLPATFNSDIGTVMPVLDRTVWLYIHTNIVIASYALIFFGSVTALLYLALRLAFRLAPSSPLAARWAGSGAAGPIRGGAASLLLARGLPAGDVAESGLARSLDGATMIFLELAFISLWVGTILGAVWADVSWGRPWGWDPKEVFAFNTWLVFLVLVHVRHRVRDKALWTALLALAGCAVMLFNWIAVNFVIVGLHSYA